jgi:hypothetical protein
MTLERFERNVILVSLGIVGFLAAGTYISIPNSSLNSPDALSQTSEVASDDNARTQCGSGIDCLSNCLDATSINYLARETGISPDEARIRVRGDNQFAKRKVELMQTIGTASIFGKSIGGEQYSILESDGVKHFLLQAADVDQEMADGLKECILAYEELKRNE